VTVDELPPRSAEHAALDGYRRSLRWKRRVYAGVVTLLVLATVVVVKVAYAHGEISHATLHTAPSEPIAPPLGPISPAPRPSWRTSDSSAIGNAVWQGTVVTTGPHTVRGRNATTGEITWSYTRTDRLVCTAIQDQGTTIAVFRSKGNCDQLMALDSSTGKRKWFRTLDKDGHPVNGTPTYSVAPYTVLVTTADVIYALDPGGGLDRWTYSRIGCTIHGAVVGVQGALISQTCTNPDCGTQQFCGPGDQVLLRDATAGRSDDDKQNPDKIKWSAAVSRPFVPVSADNVLSAQDPVSNSLRTFDVKKGTTVAEFSLPGTPADGQTVAQQSVADAEVLWINGSTVAVPNTGDRVLWSMPSAGPPVVLPTLGSESAPGAIATVTFLVPTASGVDTVAGTSGTPSRRYPVEAPSAGSSVQPFGSAFVVTGPATVAYR
jgi:outer membrane protein assembly factor BamB